MTYKKTYIISTETANGVVSNTTLHDEIEVLGLTDFIGVRPEGPDQIVIEFENTISAGELTSLSNTLAGHEGVDIQVPSHVEEEGDITTTSKSFVMVSGMAITPYAGDYLVYFSGQISNSSKKKTTSMAIFVDNTAHSQSEKTFKTKSNGDGATFTCIAKISVDGSQIVEGRWGVTGGTATMHGGRLLSLVEV